MSIMSFTQCMRCKNLKKKEGSIFICNAFPNGIPQEYLEYTFRPELYGLEKSPGKKHDKIDPRQEGDYVFESIFYFNF